MTPLITSIPIRLDVFFKEAEQCRGFTLTELELNNFSLHIPELNKAFLVDKITENGEGELYHSEYLHYFLILRETPARLLYKRIHYYLKLEELYSNG